MSAYEEVRCPDCGGEMISRTGKFGVFWGWSAFSVQPHPTVAKWSLIATVIGILYALLSRIVKYRPQWGKQHHIEWQFNPNTLQIKTNRVNLTRLNDTDPTISLEIHILNASGRHITITSVAGRVYCGGDSGLGDASIDTPIELPSSDSTYGVYIHQKFSPAVGAKIIWQLSMNQSITSFSCDPIRFIAIAGDAPTSIPLSRANCFVKGPFSIENAEDQSAMQPIQAPMFVSQYEYEHWSGNRKPTRSL